MPLHAQARELLDVLAGLSPEATGEVDAAREAPGLGDAVTEILRGRGEDTSPEDVGRVEDRSVPGPAGDVAIRVYRPRDGGSGLPVLIYVHGGGWVVGDLDGVDDVARRMANAASCLVVSVDYRRAPEDPFPASHDDVLAATRWVVDHGDELNADASRVVIAGESAGATMAAATCLGLAREGRAVPRGQLLVYPLTDLVGADWDSYRDAGDTPSLTRDALAWFAGHEAPDEEQRRDPRLSLLRMSADELAAMPPTLLFTAEEDPLRDEGEAFARALMDARVHVTVSRFPGMMHGFLGAFAVLNGAKLAMLQAVAFVQAGFQGYEPTAQDSAKA